MYPSDSNLSTKVQINKVFRMAGCHLRNVAFVKKHVDESSMRKLIHNPVISRLDYRNSLYYGFSVYRLKKIQRIKNRAAILYPFCQGTLGGVCLHLLKCSLTHIPASTSLSPQNSERSRIL